MLELAKIFGVIIGSVSFLLIASLVLIVLTEMLTKLAFRICYGKIRRLGLPPIVEVTNFTLKTIMEDTDCYFFHLEKKGEIIKVSMEKLECESVEREEDNRLEMIESKVLYFQKKGRHKQIILHTERKYKLYQ